MLRLEKHVEAELKMSSGPAYSAVNRSKEAGRLRRSPSKH
jgi:hypothetical protein